MKVVLLAGGFGSRISEESQFKPNPMIEIKKNNINGQSNDNKKEIKPYLLFQLITAGLNRKGSYFLFHSLSLPQR